MQNEENKEAILESKPIHHSQKKINENEKGVHFALKLRINHSS